MKTNPFSIALISLLLVMTILGCKSMTSTQQIVARLAIKVGVVAVVTSNPELAPVLSSAADILISLRDQVSPSKVQDLLEDEIRDSNWPANYKALALGSIGDVMLIYQDFYERHADKLTDSELLEVLNTIGVQIKMGTTLTGVSSGEVPPVETKQLLIYVE